MKKNPWLYIPTLYLAEGFPYIIINTVSTVLYADLGFSNKQIAFWTGWLYLPWVLKMFWSPLVDARATKRRWLLGAQTLLAGIFVLLAGLTAWQAFEFASAGGKLSFFSLSLFSTLINTTFTSFLFMFLTLSSFGINLLQ